MHRGQVLGRHRNQPTVRGYRQSPGAYTRKSLGSAQPEPAEITVPHHPHVRDMTGRGNGRVRGEVPGTLSPEIAEQFGRAFATMLGEGKTIVLGRDTRGSGPAIRDAVIAGLTGSASGGLSIALPVLAPYYQTTDVNMDQLHRISSIASGALDSLPHNGYVVTTIRAICRETHRSAYWPVAALTVVIPLIGLVLAVILMQWI